MKEIPITGKRNGKYHVVVGYAIVDDDDYGKVKSYSWSFASHGCARARINNKMIKMHRLIMGFPDSDIDHIDHNPSNNPSNNQKSNLRLCNCSKNAANMVKHLTHKGKQTSSKYKGVSWAKHANKWLAQIKVNNKAINLGLFTKETEAADIYKNAAKQYFGEFAYA